VVSHAVHAFPSVPQRVSLGGETHDEPLQQPVVHESELQTQAPLMHSCPSAQGGLLPHSHAPALEHLSASVALHSTHADPPFPQLSTDGES